MPNEFVRSKTIARIEGAMAEYELTRQVDHSGLKGYLREIVVRGILQPALPPSLKIGSGIIVDSKGRQSSQTDIIVYSPDLMPPVLYSEDTGIFPVEACFFTMEVKSKLDNREVRKSISAGKKLNKFDYEVGVVNMENNHLDRVGSFPVYRIVFAFESDLSGDPEQEPNRFSKIQVDPKSKGVDCLCIVGRGMWAYSWRKSGPALGVFPATDEYDEVLALLYSMHNSIPIIKAHRHIPRWGLYFHDE